MDKKNKRNLLPQKLLTGWLMRAWELLSGLLALFALVFTITACQSGNLTSSLSPSVSGVGQTVDEVAAIRTNLAGQYIKVNKLDAAMQQIQLALQADTKYAPAYDMMGVLLQTEDSLPNLQKAESYFKKAIELDAGFVRAHNNYGVYLYKMGRYAEAAEQLGIAATTLGYNGRISALENLGRTRLKLGNTELAKQSFVKVLDNSPTNLIAHKELVDILIAEHKIKQAQQLYIRLITLAPKPLSSSILRQGIVLATKQQDTTTQQALSQQLLVQYPNSDEAKNLNNWLKNPEALWK